jgi:hypothetical protein
MADPRIVYLGSNVDWPEPISIGRDAVWRDAPRQIVGQSISHGSVLETVRISQFDEIRIAHEMFVSRSFYRSLWTFMSHAMKGTSFSFAMDRDKVVDATIDTWGNPLRVTLLGGSSAILGSGGSPVEYKLLRADRSGWALVQSTGASLVSGSTYDVTLVSLPPFTFAAGDIFRDPYYWPALVMLAPEVSGLQENSGVTYTLDMRAREFRT